MPESTALPSFGTDGWRATIAEQYTFANVCLVAQGIAANATASWDHGRGILVGYDTRFGSDRFARAVCETLAGNGIKSFLAARPSPTPACCYSIPKLGACGGVIITASHNPPSDNGIKVRTSKGAAVDPKGLSEIEACIGEAAQSGVKRMGFEDAVGKGLIETHDVVPAYLDGLRRMVDIDRLAAAGIPVVVDSMYGAGAGCMTSLFEGKPLKLYNIRDAWNPGFPGLARPEPIPPHVQALSKEVVRRRASVGIANDGDADRLGVVDENGDFVDQLRTMSLLAYYVLEYHKPPGPVVRTVTTSSMLDRICDLYGVRVVETGVGMKFVAPAMEQVGAVMGGEESGGYVFARHMPERDGVMAGLLFLDLMAREGKSPSELVRMLFEKLGREYHYGRQDFTFPAERREEILRRVSSFRPDVVDGSPLVDVSNLAGHKLRLADGSWLLIRFSGTEALLRVYAETTSAKRVKVLLQAGARATGLT